MLGVEDPKNPDTLRIEDMGMATLISTTTFIVLIEPFFDVD